MARLNEPAATSTESVDSLKRKFMRQNRDIARANSTQSLRIRSLENEVSRLLSENLGLREQIARLQGELDHGRAQKISENTHVLKAQLEVKLLELGALVTGLGEEPAPRERSPQIGQIKRSSPATSPDQRNWKNMCTLSEAFGGQEGRLPPILENKSYPRKTLEREEVQAIAADNGVDTTASPDIGPPPVSQFVDEDPVKIDLPRRTRKEESEDVTGLDPALSVNLEQRRKRKDSTGPSEPKKSSKDEAAREAAVKMKAGAKRKLSVCEDEEARPRTETSSPDDFKYTRTAGEERSRNKSQPRSEKFGGRHTKETSISPESTQEKHSTANITATRKILAPKSVNSPRKTLKAVVLDDRIPAKDDLIKPNVFKEHPSERTQETVQIQLPADPITTTVELQPEPETPAGLDLFSPLSSQPSTARIESRDTPPPPDMNAGSDAQRPNRRARGAVSYAEPNLRDKMRRPSKELVDAVVRDQKATREKAIKVDDGITQDSVKIKPEPEADDAWKQMPVAISATAENSPLNSRVSAPELLPSSIMTHRKRRESILNQVDMDAARSGSATAIAALLAETRKAKAAAKQKAAGNEAAITTGYGKLDMYEFKGSDEPCEEPPKQEKTAGPRVSRRQTSVTRDVQVPSDGEASNLEVAKRSQPSASSRRQSTLGLRSASTSSLHTGEQGPEKSLKRSASTTAMSNAVVVASRNDRSDRISARRRSMML